VYTSISYYKEMLKFMSIRSELGIVLRRLENRTGFYRTTPTSFFENSYRFPISNEYAKLFSQLKRHSLKWDNYPEVYMEVFDGLRGRKDLKILEIGVLHGGSLELLRAFFDKSSRIMGIDIDNKCANVATDDTSIRIGSSTDPDFLNKCVKELGGIDIVIDDGSHDSRHQRIAFETLFPLLKDGGIYLIEDLEHSYYWGSRGLFFLPFTFMNYAKRTSEQVNSAFRAFRKRGVLRGTSENLWSVKFYTGIVVFTKKLRSRPRIIESGNLKF